MIVWYHPANNLGTQLLHRHVNEESCPTNTTNIFLSPIFSRNPSETTKVHIGRTSGPTNLVYWKNHSFHLKSLATYSFYQQDAVCGGWRTLVSHGNKTTMETEPSSSRRGDQQGHLLCHIEHARDGDSSSNMKMANASPSIPENRPIQCFKHY